MVNIFEINKKVVSLPTVVVVSVLFDASVGPLAT